MAFDGASAIRERLALLAALGPNLTPSDWGYHPRRDFWYFCGDESRRGRSMVSVKTEGSVSLDIIKERHKMSRRGALAFIGYPEQR